MSVDNALPHLDLDTIAWQATSPPSRTPISEAAIKIKNFTDMNDTWVIEGCYSDLLKLTMVDADEVIFLNLPVEDCIENAKSRPWEPHKYESRQAQDSNLDMLVKWISQYSERKDDFSQKAHVDLFNSFKGKKQMYTRNS